MRVAMSEGEKPLFAHAHMVLEHSIMCREQFQELEGSNVDHAVFEFTFTEERGSDDLLCMNEFLLSLAVVESKALVLELLMVPQPLSVPNSPAQQRCHFSSRWL